MTADFFPEASPIPRVDETTWAVHFAEAVEQRNLDIVRLVVSEDEDEEFMQAFEEFETLPDDELGAMLADEFPDETDLAEALASLGEADSDELQFATVGQLGTARQKAGVFEVCKRIRRDREQPQ